jgi:hypothetical protein
VVAVALKVAIIRDTVQDCLLADREVKAICEQQKQQCAYVQTVVGGSSCPEGRRHPGHGSRLSAGRSRSESK